MRTEEQQTSRRSEKGELSSPIATITALAITVALTSLIALVINLIISVL